MLFLFAKTINSYIICIEYTKKLAIFIDSSYFNGLDIKRWYISSKDNVYHQNGKCFYYWTLHLTGAW